MKNFWQKNKWTILTLGLFLIIGSFLSFKGVSAESLLDKVGSQEGVPKTELPVLVGNIIKVVLGLLGFVLVILIIWAGVLWMTAGGDSGKVQTATKMLTNAVIGLAIVVSAYAIASFVLTSLNNATSNSGTGTINYLLYPLLKK